MIYIVGGEGFIGSAFVRELKERNIEYCSINRENFDRYIGTSCDLLINANGNSKKYLAEQNPLLDFNLSVNSVLETLVGFKYKKYVFLSSGDVYPDQSTPDVTKEDQDIDTLKQSRYGFHKYIAENLVKKYAENWLIFRMGGFVGDGLKKNAVYDILNNKDIWISSESELQFIGTEAAAKIILNISTTELNNQIINFGADGVVKISEIHKIIQSNSQYVENAKKIKFELSLEKLKKIIGDSIPRTLDQIEKFIRTQKK